MLWRRRPPSPGLPHRGARGELPPAPFGASDDFQSRLPPIDEQPHLELTLGRRHDQGWHVVGEQREAAAQDPTHIDQGNER